MIDYDILTVLLLLSSSSLLLLLLLLLIRKKFGYNVSEQMTVEFSRSAVQAECRGVEQVTSHERSTLALVPFFGGRPPNVTADLKVQSLGQGNSLVKGEVKAMQTLAVVCSLLRNFAYVVVGVTRPEDEAYITDTVRHADTHP
jgi:hypothetical protein